MTYSYKQFSDGMFQSDGLYGSGNRMVTLMLLADRMRLSRTKHDKYYDSKMKDFYVIYKQEKMSDKVGYNKKTAGHMYEHLENSGYIIRKKIGTKKTDKIFLSDKTKKMFDILPSKDNESSDDEQSSKDDSEQKDDPKQDEKKSDRGENNSNEKEKNSNSEKNFPSSNSYLNKSDVSHRDNVSFNDSVNSAQPKNEKSSSSQSKDSKDQKETTPSSLHLESLGKKQARTTKRWIAAVHKKLQLDTAVIHSVLKISHCDIPKAYHVINLIKNARTNIANDNHLAWNDKRIRFESNQNLGARLADKLLYISNYAKKKVNNTEERGKYFTTSLKEFIKDAIGLSEHRPQVKPQMQEDRENEEIDQTLPDRDAMQSNDQDDTERPNIPIFKIV